MLCFKLRCSRLEFLFVTSCHLCALLAVFHASILIYLTLIMSVGVIASYTVYLKGLYLSFFRVAANSAESPQLTIGQQSACLSLFGETVTTELPSVSCLNEFLLILSFVREQNLSRKAGRAGKFSGNVIRLVLWPDSLSPSDSKRLRRYLRFDCPNSSLQR